MTRTIWQIHHRCSGNGTRHEVGGLTNLSNRTPPNCHKVRIVNDAPIGVFDSGLGGLTVARAIIDQLPNEDIVYLGDSAHTPYGPRRLSEVRKLTLAGLDQLVQLGCKLLVIACNTATAAALRDARERYVKMGIPVIEVVTPAARGGAATTRNGSIGVLGTAATVRSGVYLDALGAVPGIRVTQSSAPKFVEFVERGETTGEAVTAAAKEYLAPLVEADVDTVILGCTHYPLLTGVLARELGPGVRLVASSEATANATYSSLVDLDLLHSPRQPGDTPKYRFYSTAPNPEFSTLARRFLGPEVSGVEPLTVELEVEGAKSARGVAATTENEERL